jgi:hypothetical protein
MADFSGGFPASEQLKYKRTAMLKGQAILAKESLRMALIFIL